MRRFFQPRNFRRSMKKCRCEQGFTLIEVLVAVVIFAIGILALAGLQTTYVAKNTAARMQTEATTLAAKWLERLRLLPYDHSDLDAGIHTRTDGHYSVSWSVTHHRPINDVKTIRVTVTAGNPNAVAVSLDYRRAKG